MSHHNQAICTKIVQSAARRRRIDGHGGRVINGIGFAVERLSATDANDGVAAPHRATMRTLNNGVGDSLLDRQRFFLAEIFENFP